MEDNKHTRQNWVIVVFLLIPIAASIISLIHSIDFLDLGNDNKISIAVAVLYEATLLACLVALSMATRVKKSIIWVTIIVLTDIQIIGNTFYSYNKMTVHMIENSQFLQTVVEFLRLENNSAADAKLILSAIIGAPVPLISFAFLKAFADYINSFINSIEIYDDYDDYDDYGSYDSGSKKPAKKPRNRFRDKNKDGYYDVPISISSLSQTELAQFKEYGRQLFGMA